MSVILPGDDHERQPEPAQSARILEYLRVFVPEGQITELRAFSGGKVRHTRLYRDHGLLVEEAAKLDRTGTTSGIYFVPNPIIESHIPAGAGSHPGTANAEMIASRRWLPIDVDPVRMDADGCRLPKQDVPASEEERLAAWNVLQRCMGALEAVNLRCPVIADSGNGWHLCYPIDLPNDDTSYRKIAAILDGLNDRCGDEFAVVDQKTKDAPRIWKLYGTTSRKGLASPTRLHRLAYVHQWEAITQADREANNAGLDRLLMIWDRQEQFRRRDTAAISDDVARARAYLEKEDPAIQGSDGSDKAFHVAGILTQGFSLSNEQAMVAISDWNARCVPPWSDWELHHKFDDARKSPCQKPWGYLLEAETPAKARVSSAASPSASTTDGESRLVTVRLDTVKVMPLEWEVPDRIPRGKLTLLSGHGGHGKTTVTLYLIAAVTTGRPAFGLAYEPLPPGDVILVSCEDDAEDTLVPRLMCAGADLSRIHFVKGIRGKDGKILEFSLQHVEAIKRTLDESPEVRLVVIDPVNAFLGRGVDDHKDSELRGLLSPLMGVAADRGISFVLIKHLNKNEGAKAVSRVGGSIAYINAVRSALLLAPDPEDESRKLLLPMKANLTKNRQGLAFRMADIPKEDADRILATQSHLSPSQMLDLRKQLFQVEWLGTVDITADDALNSPKKKEDHDDVAEIDRAAAWLKLFLSQGPKHSEECVRQGNEHLKKERKKPRKDGKEELGMPWWRDKILKGKLGGYSQGTKTFPIAWHWHLPNVYTTPGGEGGADEAVFE